MQEIRYDVDRFVKAGFDDSAGIVSQILDQYYYEKVDTAWIRSAVGRAYRKMRRDQASWPALTDFDRLVKVFDYLDSIGVIALHNAGNTKDEGVEDANEIRKSLVANGIPCRGYCCYDTQDVDGAIDGNYLYLTFGCFSDGDKACVRIGHEICAALHRFGCKTRWDQSCQTRIATSRFKWQNRFGNRSWTYAHAKEILSRRK